MLEEGEKLQAFSAATVTVVARSNPGIVGSNPIQGMDVCCAGSGLATS
jgi:hypothetical protein